MDLNIDKEALKGRSLFIGTPMYGGMCTGAYTQSCIDLAGMLKDLGVEYQVYYVFNASLITIGRNYIADAFLKSGCSHMMFIDSDIGFDPHNVLEMLALAEPDSDKHVLCGPYARKAFNWANVKTAVERGFASPNPQNLNKYVGDILVNSLENRNQIPLDRPFKIKAAGTGFMMIQRQTLEIFEAAYPELKFISGYTGEHHVGAGQEMTAFFDTFIDPVSRRYLSEDIMFCEYCIEAGLDIWLCPWMRLEHVGGHVFESSLADLAALQQ